MKKPRIIMFCMLLCLLIAGCENRDSELYEQGMAALEKEDYVTSIAMFQGAVEAGERLAESYRGKGIAYLNSGEYEKALEAFENSLSSMKYPNDSFSRDVKLYEVKACMSLEALDQAIGICDEILEAKGDADAFFLRGRAYFLKKEYDLAKADFDQAVNLEENYAMCLDIYELYQESALKADGNRYLEMAEKIVPENTADEYELGCVYYYLEDDQKAAEMLNRAVEGGSVEAFMLLGRIYLDDGRTSDAKALYQSGLSGEGFEAAANNGLALCALSDGDTSGALTYIDEGLKTADENIREELLFNQIVAYEQNHDFAQAKNLMSVFLKSYPENEEAIRENQFLQSR
ncbi:MAG: tetratricopeptide repeat protein [Fusicatenibacter sp.]|nr:tetratricopeptide repeat protein [Fusicatenibacter sp.]